MIVRKIFHRNAFFNIIILFVAATICTDTKLCTNPPFVEVDHMFKVTPKEVELSFVPKVSHFVIVKDAAPLNVI